MIDPTDLGDVTGFIDQPDEQLIGHLDTPTMIRLSKVDWASAIRRRIEGMTAFIERERALADEFLAQKKH